MEMAYPCPACGGNMWSHTLFYRTPKMKYGCPTKKCEDCGRTLQTLSELMTELYPGVSEQ